MSVIHYSSRDVAEHVLPAAGSDELLALTQLFDESATAPLAPSELAQKIMSAGGHVVGNGLRGQGVPYTTLLYDTAKSVKCPEVEPPNTLTSTGLTIAEMDERALDARVNSGVSQSWQVPIEKYVDRQEQELLKKIMLDTYDRMSDQQKAEVDRRVIELAGQLPGSGIKGLTASAAFLVVANAGGFATYMLMSTVIGTLTAGLAGFGMYTAASSALSVLLGPAGWTALGLAAIYKLGGPSPQRRLKAVVTIAMLRARIHSVGIHKQLSAMGQAGTTS